MKKFLVAISRDGLQLSGLLLILLSSLAFGITMITRVHTNTDSPLFLFNYAITVIYTLSFFIHTYSNYRWSLAKTKLNYTMYLLILWFISAFALNLEINIFESSANWLCVYIFIASSTLVVATFSNWMGKVSRQFFMFFLGASLILFTYYATYLIPFYALGLLGALFLGLTLHLLIPLLLLIVSIVKAVRSLRTYPELKYAFSAGIVLPLIFCSWFLFQWNNLYEKITSIVNHDMLKESTLPTWIAVGQQIPPSTVTEKMLKSGIVYAIPRKKGSWFWGDFQTNSFAEKKQHDPLVMIASFVIGQPTLDDADKIKILKAMYDARHPAQERLWSGENLVTQNVVSNVKIYPEYRLAFTEKTFSIRNQQRRTWAGNEEAIYTFQLSEGSVVSSLSLWINGVEEKARLTTRGKADTAYNSIVGVERRDPSVIHWQEGNKVTVRVFPCNAIEDRRFRIGITSPLKKIGNRLQYENPSINGPESVNADETLQLVFSKTPKSLNAPFKVKTDGSTLSDRKYQNNWNISFETIPISAGTFSFNKASYKLQELKTIKCRFSVDRIYLDINSSWTEKEFQAIWDARGSKEVYVFDGRLKKVESQNMVETFETLHTLNFSLFPFYLIPESEHSLIITKGTNNSANLSDLKGSIFQKRSTNYFAKSKRVHLYNIGSEKNAYIKTLKEFGVFDYNEGDIKSAIDDFQRNLFHSNQNTPAIVNIESAKMAILKTIDSGPSDAPDHLLRLFAYNNILQKVGQTYFEPNYVNDELIDIASEAYVVSPVSSLIVLETVEDYKRFGIEESKNSLQNASINSSGAAPEPHEWLLILMGVIIITYYLSKERKKFSSGLLTSLKL